MYSVCDEHNIMYLYMYNVFLCTYMYVCMYMHTYNVDVIHLGVEASQSMLS